MLKKAHRGVLVYLNKTYETEFNQLLQKYNEMDKSNKKLNKAIAAYNDPKISDEDRTALYSKFKKEKGIFNGKKQAFFDSLGEFNTKIQTELELSEVKLYENDFKGFKSLSKSERKPNESDFDINTLNQQREQYLLSQEYAKTQTKKAEFIEANEKFKNKVGVYKQHKQKAKDLAFRVKWLQDNEFELSPRIDMFKHMDELDIQSMASMMTHRSKRTGWQWIGSEKTHYSLLYPSIRASMKDMCRKQMEAPYENDTLSEGFEKAVSLIEALHKKGTNDAKELARECAGVTSEWGWSSQLKNLVKINHPILSHPKLAKMMAEELSLDSQRNLFRTGSPRSNHIKHLCEASDYNEGSKTQLKSLMFDSYPVFSKKLIFKGSYSIRHKCIKEAIKSVFLWTYLNLRLRTKKTQTLPSISVCMAWTMMNEKACWKKVLLRILKFWRRCVVLKIWLKTYQKQTILYHD